jgi:WD40 repeat protein
MGFPRPRKGHPPWPDGRLATGCRNGTLRIEDAFTGRVEREVQMTGVGPYRTPAAARCAAWANNCVAAGARDGSLTFVGSEETRKVKLPGWVFTISWDPTGTRLAVGSGCALCVLSDKGDVAFEVAHTENVVACSWSPCGGLIATASECSLQILDACDGSKVSEVQSESAVRCVAWSPCGKYVTTGGDDGVIRFIDRNGTIDRVFDPPGCSSILSIAYNP